MSNRSLGASARAVILASAVGLTQAVGGTGAALADGHAEGVKPLTELTEALAAARIKLEVLDQATNAITHLRDELSANREENRQLLRELQMLRARRAEWVRAEDTARSQIAELAQALDEAKAQTGKLEGEVASLRSANSQLDDRLRQVRAAEQSARDKLGARIEGLEGQIAAGGAEIERLRQDQAVREAHLTDAIEEGRRSAARVLELEAKVASAESDLADLDKELTDSSNLQEEISMALAMSEQDRMTAESALAVERARGDELRSTLAAAEADLGRAQAVNRDLELRSAEFEEAATVASATAIENLRAFESEIAALNSTLAEVELLTTTDALDDAAGEGKVEKAPTDKEDDRDLSAIVPAAGPQRLGNGEMALVKVPEPDEDTSAGTLAKLTDGLPLEMKIQAQNLLADVEIEEDSDGIKLVVPGSELFGVNAVEVRDAAHESLAQIAELINIYEGHSVLIIAHTDAVGALDYNRSLSLQRAEFIKEFFVESFDVEPDRLEIRGMGEERPIASNATDEGRRANRRVEVLIRN